MSIKLVKKIFAAGLTLTVFITPVLAESLTMFNDGYVVIEDSSRFLEEGAILTVTAVEKGMDWESFEDISSIPKEKIEFYGAFSAGSDGVYKIEFSPEENGEYTVYVGAHVFDEPRKYEVLYINKTEFENAFELLSASNTDEEFADVLSAKKDELGLFDSVFEDVDMQDVAKLAKDDVLEVDYDSAEEVVTLLKKAALIVKLNENEVEDIKEYSDIIKLSENKYFDEGISEEITEGISGEGIKALEEFDELLFESIILANINNKSSGVIMEVLKEYYSEIDIPEAKIIDSLCKKIAQDGNFDSLEDLADYVKSYKTESSGGSGGSGGSKGSGNNFSGASTSQKLPNMPLNTNIDKTEQNAFKLPFEDMAGYDWATDAITNLYLKSVINGKSEKLFCPGETVTREEFVKMLTVAFKMNLVDGEMSFSDVPESAWFAPYVRTAYNAKIVNGQDENLFGTGQNITREDLCVMVSRALYAGDLKLSDDDGEIIEFNDETEIADYAKDAVNQLSKAGIVNGYAGNFRPKASATRAEAAKIIYMITKSVGL